MTKAKKKRTNVRLFEDVHARLKSQAAQRHTSIEILMEQAARELLERIEADENGTVNLMPLIQGLANTKCEVVTMDDLETLINLRRSLMQDLNPNLIQELLMLKRPPVVKK